MNQILRLPLLKYTRTQKKKHVKNKTKKPKKNKKNSTILPPQEKRGHPQHPRRSSLRQ